MEDMILSNLVTNKPKFSVAIQSDMYKNLINQTLGDKERATRFIASISSAVATNQALQECDAGTILSGALLGESLNLSINISSCFTFSGCSSGLLNTSSNCS